MTKGFNVYLLSMNICGIKNLDKPVHISFYNETITNKFDPSNFRIKGIYGENGVGKSAIISAVYFYKELLVNNWFLKTTINDTKIKYLINKKGNKASFTFEFLINTKIINIYKHSIELTINENNMLEITKEEAYHRTVNTEYKRIFKVENGNLEFSLNNKVLDNVKAKTMNRLKESSLISFMPSFKENGKFDRETFDLDTIYYFGLSIYVYLNNADRHNEYVVKEYYKTNNYDFEKVLKTVALDYISCTGRTVIHKNSIKEYEGYVKDLVKFIKIYKPDLKDIIVDKTPNKDEYYCALIFKYDKYDIAAEFESTGIKRLVELYFAFRLVSKDYIVFIDELDVNIHDYYLCRLLEYVAEYTEGQLCFTSHNLGPMEVLKDYKKSIDFLSRDGEIVPWIKNGNYNVANQYKEGKIRKFPFNIESFDFIKVFGNGE